MYCLYECFGQRENIQAAKGKSVNVYLIIHMKNKIHIIMLGEVGFFKKNYSLHSFTGKCASRHFFSISMLITIWMKMENQWIFHNFWLFNLGFMSFTKSSHKKPSNPIINWMKISCQTHNEQFSLQCLFISFVSLWTNVACDASGRFHCQFSISTTIMSWARFLNGQNHGKN